MCFLLTVCRLSHNVYNFIMIYQLQAKLFLPQHTWYHTAGLQCFADVDFHRLQLFSMFRTSGF